MGHAENQHVIVILHPIDNYIFANGKAPSAHSKIIFAGAPQVGMSRKQKKPVGDGMN